MRNFIIDFSIRMLVIISMLLVLRFLCYREGFKNYVSQGLVRGEPCEYTFQDNFDQFIYEYSLEELLRDYNDENTLGRIQFAELGIDLPVQADECASKNDKDYWGRTSEFGIIRSDSTADDFCTGVTVIQGNGVSGKMFGKLRRYEKIDFAENNKSFVVFKDGKIKPFVVFAITKTMPDLNEMNGISATVNWLRDNSIFDLEYGGSASSVVLIQVNFLDDDQLIIGGYYR